MTAFGASSSFAELIETALRDGFILPAHARELVDREQEDDPVSALQQLGAITAAQGRGLRQRAGSKPHDYLVLGELGTGGMGSVFLARRRDEAEARVALKRVRLQSGAGAGRFRRLLREAEICRRLDHPAIARLIEVREDHEDVLLIFQYVPGITLAEKLQDGPLSDEQVRRIARGLLEGLAHAHQRGIVHRDLKPGNVIVGRQDRPVLLDFGISRLTAREGLETLTRSGLPVGTYAYMSPEHLGDSHGVDARSDLFCFGVMLYEMLTGVHPFRARSIAATLDRIRDTAPPPPSRLRSLLPGLETICLKCMEKDPLRRYQTAQAALDDLNAEEAGHPLAASPPSRRSRHRHLLTKYAVLLAAVLVPLGPLAWFAVPLVRGAPLDRATLDPLFTAMSWYVLFVCMVWSTAGYQFRSTWLRADSRERSGWQRTHPGSVILSFSRRGLLFPDICACCGGPADRHRRVYPETVWGSLTLANPLFLQMIYSLLGHLYKVPYCDSCDNLRSKIAGSLTSARSLLSGGLALIAALGVWLWILFNALGRHPVAVAVVSQHPVVVSLVVFLTVLGLSWLVLGAVISMVDSPQSNRDSNHVCADVALRVLGGGIDAVTFEACNEDFAEYLLVANADRAFEYDRGGEKTGSLSQPISAKQAEAIDKWVRWVPRIGPRTAGVGFLIAAVLLLVLVLPSLAVFRPGPPKFDRLKGEARKAFGRRRWARALGACERALKQRRDDELERWAAICRQKLAERAAAQRRRLIGSQIPEQWRDDWIQAVEKAKRATGLYHEARQAERSAKSSRRQQGLAIERYEKAMTLIEESLALCGRVIAERGARQGGSPTPLPFDAKREEWRVLRSVIRHRLKSLRQGPR